MITGRIKPELYVLKNLLYTTVRISLCDDAGAEVGSGTGFFYRVKRYNEYEGEVDVDLLVTNKHVIEGVQVANIYFHQGPVVDGFPSGSPIRQTIYDFESKFTLHPELNVDLCAMEISSYIKDVEHGSGRQVHYQAYTYQHLPDDDTLRKMFPISDVYMVGYPNGLWDSINNLPITRKGATASHPWTDFEGGPVGVVDIATFEGSSGSPIIVYHLGDTMINPSEPEFYILGVLFEGAILNVDGEMVKRTIPTGRGRRRRIPSVEMTIHLGYYVKAKELYTLGELFE